MREPGEVSAAKKQANNKRVITKSRIKSTSDPIVKPVGTGKHKKVLLQEVTTNTTVKSHRNIVLSEHKGVTNLLSGVTSAGGTIEQKCQH